MQNCFIIAFNIYGFNRKIKNRIEEKFSLKKNFNIIFYLIFIVGTVLELSTNHVTFLKIVGRFKKIFGTRMLARLFDGVQVGRENVIVVVDLCGIFDLPVLEICLTICKMCWRRFKKFVSRILNLALGK